VVDNNPTTSVERFDVLKQEWAMSGNMIFPKKKPLSICVGPNIFVIESNNEDSYIEMYDN